VAFSLHGHDLQALSFGQLEHLLDLAVDREDLAFL
jgi:hypothetical protein